MRSYTKKTIRIAGLLDHDIETWFEHNHASVYSNGAPLFDGDQCEASIRIKKEIDRICKIAESYGFTAEVINAE